MGELENHLVERIIAATWRLRRLGRVEAGIFAFELYGQLAERARQEARMYTRIESEESPLDDLLQSIHATQITIPTKTIITDEQKHQEAIERAHKLERVRKAEATTLGQTFIRDANKANAFSKLSRYETAIERSLYRALHELQRLQAARRAQGNVPPRPWP